MKHTREQRHAPNTVLRIRKYKTQGDSTWGVWMITDYVKQQCYTDLEEEVLEDLKVDGWLRSETRNGH
jgi:hypothetical protein